MKVITRKSLAAEAVERWKSQYSLGTKMHGNYENWIIYNALVALGPSPTPEAVNQAIGNDAWTVMPDCDECKQPQDLVVQLGEEPDYDSRTAHICQDCLTKAALEAARVSVAS